MKHCIIISLLSLIVHLSSCDFSFGPDSNKRNRIGAGYDKKFSHLDVYLAIKDHDEEKAISLIEEGTKGGSLDINEKQLSLLHTAVEERLPKVVEKLIDVGADLEILNSIAYTPLGYGLLNARLASYDNENKKFDEYLNVIEILLDRGANSGKTQPRGASYTEPIILFYDTWDRSDLALKALKTANLDVTEPVYKNNILHLVAKNDDVKFIKNIIRYLPSERSKLENLLNKKNRYDMEPLCYAMNNQNFALMSIMQDYGAKCTYNNKKYSAGWDNYNDFFNNWKRYYGSEGAGSKNDFYDKINIDYPKECEPEFSDFYKEKYKTNLKDDVYNGNSNKKNRSILEKLREQVRFVYKRLSMKFHPDKCKEVDCEDKFKKISECHEIIVEKGIDPLMKILDANDEKRKETFKEWEKKYEPKSRGGLGY